MPSPTRRPGFVLQERDRAVLALLWRFGPLTSDHIHRLVFSGVSERVSRRRLTGIARRDLVHRTIFPRMDRDLGAALTGRPVYTLSARGADTLEPPQRVDRQARTTIEHDLLANHLLFHFPSGELMAEPELRRAIGAARQAGHCPSGMIVPDGAVTTPGGTLFLEFVRTGVRGGSHRFVTKYRRYLQLIRTGAFRRVFGHQRVRAVLVVTPSPGRAKTLLHHASQLRDGRERFLVGVSGQDGSLPKTWTRGDGAGVTLESLYS